MRAFLASIAWAAISITALFDADAQVRVSGHVRSNGTYVQPHFRSAPDGIVSNNWSAKGNVNPYTGKPGTRVAPPGLATRSASVTAVGRSEGLLVGPHATSHPNGYITNSRSAFGSTNLTTAAPEIRRTIGPIRESGTMPKADSNPHNVRATNLFESQVRGSDDLPAYSTTNSTVATSRTMQQPRGEVEAELTRWPIIVVVVADNFFRSGRQRSAVSYFGASSNSARIGTRTATLAAKLPPVTRTWTSEDYRFTTEAEFRGKIEQTVRLRKSDGTTVEVHWDRLSVADQTWIMERRRVSM